VIPLKIRFAQFRHTAISDKNKGNKNEQGKNDHHHREMFVTLSRHPKNTAGSPRKYVRTAAGVTAKRHTKKKRLPIFISLFPFFTSF